VLDDETLRAASVTADGRLLAGLGSYRVVILAYTQYISTEALEKLTTFTEAGGTVIFVGDPPAHGLRPDQETAIASLMEKLDSQPSIKRYTSSRLMEALAPVAHRDLTVSVTSGDKANFLMADFENATRDVTFMVNASYADTVVKAAYADGYVGTAALYHPETGYIETVTLGDGREITVPACTGLILVREADNTRDDTPYTPSESETETQPAVPDTEPTPDESQSTENTEPPETAVDSETGEDTKDSESSEGSNPDVSSEITTPSDTTAPTSPESTAETETNAPPRAAVPPPPPQEP
jgi:hypothetical protein